MYGGLHNRFLTWFGPSFHLIPRHTMPESFCFPGIKCNASLLGCIWAAAAFV